MRTREEVEKRLEEYKGILVPACIDDPENGTRIYSAYRALYWVLHPEINDPIDLALSIRVALGVSVEGGEGMEDQTMIKLRDWLKKYRSVLKRFALDVEGDGLSPTTLWFIDGQRTMSRLVELQLDIWDSENKKG